MKKNVLQNNVTPLSPAGEDEMSASKFVRMVGERLKNFGLYHYLLWNIDPEY